MKKGLITSPKTTVIMTTTKETTLDDALSFEKDDQLVDEETEARIIFNKLERILLAFENPLKASPRRAPCAFGHIVFSDSSSLS